MKLPCNWLNLIKRNKKISKNYLNERAYSMFIFYYFPGLKNNNCRKKHIIDFDHVAFSFQLTFKFITSVNRHIYPQLRSFPLFFSLLIKLRNRPSRTWKQLDHNDAAKSENRTNNLVTNQICPQLTEWEGKKKYRGGATFRVLVIRLQQLPTKLLNRDFA